MVRYWLRTSPAEVKSGSVLVVCLRHLTVFFFFFLFQKIASFLLFFLCGLQELCGISIKAGALLCGTVESSNRNQRDYFCL